jgi:hypothetical protein
MVWFRKERPLRDNVDIALSSDTPPSGVSGGLDVWLYVRIADRRLPICRSKDEPHPSCTIVHASSTLVSRIGAAGYKLMRTSHAMDFVARPAESTFVIGITRADTMTDK